MYVLGFTPFHPLTYLVYILIIYLLPSRADSLESKVEELAQRLENQTAEVIRLTLELEEYEYKDFGTANNSNHNKDDDEYADTCKTLVRRKGRSQINIKRGRRRNKHTDRRIATNHTTKEMN